MLLSDLWADCWPTHFYTYIYMLLTDQWADFWPRPSFSIPTCHLLISGQIPSPHMFYTYMLINDQWADFWPKHSLYLYASYWSFVRFRAHAFSIPTGICYILVFCQISSPRFCIPICYLMICWQISGPGILYTYMLLTDHRLLAQAFSIPICYVLVFCQISSPRNFYTYMPLTDLWADFWPRPSCSTPLVPPPPSYTSSILDIF